MYHNEPILHVLWFQRKFDNYSVLYTSQSRILVNLQEHGYRDTGECFKKFDKFDDLEFTVEQIA